VQAGILIFQVGKEWFAKQALFNRGADNLLGLSSQMLCIKWVKK